MRAALAGIAASAVFACYEVPSTSSRLTVPVEAIGPTADAVSDDARQLALARAFQQRGDHQGALREYLAVARKQPPSPLAAQALFGVGDVLSEGASTDETSLNTAREAFRRAMVAPGATAELAQEARDRIGQIEALMWKPYGE